MTMRPLTPKFPGAAVAAADHLAGKKIKKHKLTLKATAKSKTSKTIKHEPFPFMELPPEIRTMIYKVLLVESTTELTFITNARSDDLKRGHIEKTDRLMGQSSSAKRVIAKAKDVTKFHPVVLRVSKDIHTEAGPVLYGQTFHFEYPAALQQFVTVIGPSNRRWLQRIVLRGWTDVPFRQWGNDFESALDKLSAAINLKSLHLDRHTKSPQDAESKWVAPGFDVHKQWRLEHFMKKTAFWASEIDGAQGKGTAASILSFSDLVFGSKDDIANDDKVYQSRKQFFLGNIKLG